MAFVDYEKKENIVTITINRPDRLNALGTEVVAELDDAFKKFCSDPEARVAILTATGRAFSVGADVKDMAKPAAQAEASSDKEYQAHNPAQEALDKIEKVMRGVTKPVITAVNGFALGSAFEAVVLQSDIRIAAESATFGMPEIGLAIPAHPDYFIAQGISLSAAMEIILLGDPITAQRAYDIGLVNKVVPDEELMTAAMKVAERIARLSPWATSLVRQFGMKVVEVSEEYWKVKQKRNEVRKMMQTSEDYHEAVKAFAEKRKPVFKGK